jgi:ABC-type multidrug transport system permease subunit
MKRAAFPALLVAHAVAIFICAVLLLITKWFPYGSTLVGLREWLYRVF